MNRTFLFVFSIVILIVIELNSPNVLAQPIAKLTLHNVDSKPGSPVYIYVLKYRMLKYDGTISPEAENTGRIFAIRHR